MLDIRAVLAKIILCSSKNSPTLGLSASGNGVREILSTSGTGVRKIGEGCSPIKRNGKESIAREVEPTNTLDATTGGIKFGYENEDRRIDDDCAFKRSGLTGIAVFAAESAASHF